MAHIQVHGDRPLPPHTVKHNRSLPICPSIALPILGLVGIGLICCLFPQVQQWIARMITHIETGQMTLGNAFVLIGVPAIAGTLLITGIVLLVKKHHQRSIETFQDGSFRDVLDTLYSCFSKKSWIFGAATIASLVITGLAIGYLQPFQHVLGGPIKIWQGLALGVGGVVVTGLAIAMIRTCGKPHPAIENELLRLSEVEDSESVRSLLLLQAIQK